VDSPGPDLTERLPELAGLADAVDAPVVLDGELVAGQGRAGDFYSLLPKIAARSRRAPLTFVAFDVLTYDNQPVIGWPYARRRALLDGLELSGEAWYTTPVLDGSEVAVLAACVEHDIEGIIAKRVDSPYRPGERSTDWLKLKTAEWRSVHADWRHEHSRRRRYFKVGVEPREGYRLCRRASAMASVIRRAPSFGAMRAKVAGVIRARRAPSRSGIGATHTCARLGSMARTTALPTSAGDLVRSPVGASPVSAHMPASRMGPS